MFKSLSQTKLPVWYQHGKPGKVCSGNDAIRASSHGVILPPPGQRAHDNWRLKYVTGNLFSCPEDEALAHCISEDCRMGAGIAVLFKQKFKGVAELKEQKKTPGQCAVLKRNRRFVYYLITKKKASQKPTYDSLRESLEDMKSHCLLNGVTSISMPRIGCGLDRLRWDRVSVILEQVFKHTNISITVYSLPERAETTVLKEHMHR